MNRLLDLYEKDLEYYFSFTGSKANLVETEKGYAYGILQRIAQAVTFYKQDDIYKKAEVPLKKYYSYFRSQREE